MKKGGLLIFCFRAKRKKSRMGSQATPRVMPFIQKPQIICQLDTAIIKAASKPILLLKSSLPIKNKKTKLIASIIPNTKNESLRPRPVIKWVKAVRIWATG